jgi:hypothetical protein
MSFVQPVTRLCLADVRTVRSLSDSRVKFSKACQDKRSFIDTNITVKFSPVERRRTVSGENNPEKLLKGMKPEMQEGIFVFCTIPEQQTITSAIPPVLMFREREGTTYVIRREEAETAGLSYQFASRLITLTVHSSLDAVGFLAAIAVRLAEAGISVNAVSAFYHDHLFVPDHRADEALCLLQSMSRPDAG